MSGVSSTTPTNTNTNVNTNTDTNNKTKSSTVTQSATANGTPIVQNANQLDKNAFFKILAAELSNMDPTQDQDSTAYITQLAQFSTMEQMTTLNSTMTFNAAQSLIGKYVALNVTDTDGIQQNGVVRAVYTYKNEVYVSVEGLDGKYTDFKYSQVSDILDTGDANMDNLTFSNAVNLVGKNVGLTVPVETKGEDGKTETTTEKISGKAIKVYRDAEGIKVKVEYEKDGKKEIKDYHFNYVTSVEN